MRSLAYGRYTHDQVADAIRSGNVSFSRRYELLDRKLNPLPLTLGTVTSAAGDHSIDRDVKGWLDLKMHPTDFLRGAFLKVLVRPWVGIRMLAIDGGWAEYPQGAYVWGEPERELGPERWGIALADQTWLWQLLSPGPDGFRVERNAVTTEVCKSIYRDHLGFSDNQLVGIVDSPETISTNKRWIDQTPNTPEYGQKRAAASSLDQVRREIGRTTDAQVLAGLRSQEATLVTQLAALEDLAPTTDESNTNWLQILSELQVGIGYNSPLTDWRGLPVAKPIPDLATTSPQHHYRTDQRSIIRDLSVTPDLSTIANRVTVKASNVDGLYGKRTADANDLFPNHELAERNLGDYLNAPTIEDSTAGTVEALQARADAELGARLARHKKAAMKLTRIDPSWEPYDLSGVQWTGDADLDSEPTFTSPSMAFDLDTFQQGFDLGLVVQP